MVQTTVVPETGHARLSASNADRWLNCPGCVKESEGMPEQTSEFAAVGTVAHLIAADILSVRATGHHSSIETYRGMKFTVQGAEVVVDDDILVSVEDYLTTVTLDCLVEDTYSVEVDLSPSLKSLDKDFGGIADLIRHDPIEHVLYVYDYKHGVGVLVEAEDNRQAKYYALGAVLKFESLKICEVEVVIVQPRAHTGDTVKRWRFPVSELLEYEVELLEGADITRGDNPATVAGPWCQFCPALAKPCPAVASAEKKLTEVTEPGVLEVISPEKVGAALLLCSALEKRIKSIRDLGFSMLSEGREVPGWKLVSKRGNRSWRDADKTREVFGADAVKEVLLSVAQVEKLTGKAEFAKIAKEKDLVVKPEGGPTLAPESDKRPPAILFSPEDFNEVPE